MNRYLILPILGIIGCLGLLLAFNMWTTVPNGAVGIVTLFGKSEPMFLSPGAHFVNPFSKVHILNTKVLTVGADSEAASNDLQIVDTSITLNYNLTTKDPTSFFNRLGSDQTIIENSIVKPAMSEAFKAVVAEFTAEQLINERPKVSIKMQSLLAEKLKQYDLGIDSISITNFQFSKAFNEAIEGKVTAQQKILTAQNDLARIKVEAEQKITEAQANATSMKLQNQTVTGEILQLEAIKKWDGKLPMYMGSNMPLMNLNNK